MLSLITIKSSDKHCCFTQRAEHDKCRKKWVGWRWISLFKSVHCTTEQDLRPGANLIKLFWRKFTHTFCRLDHFINAYNNCLVQWKNLAYKPEWVNLHQKKFYEINSWPIFYTHCHYIFWWNISSLNILEKSLENVFFPNVEQNIFQLTKYLRQSIDN